MPRRPASELMNKACRDSEASEKRMMGTYGERCRMREKVTETSANFTSRTVPRQMWLTASGALLFVSEKC